MKIYVASSWRNQQQPDVVRALRDAGHEVYDFKNPQPGDKGFGWSEIDPNWKAWTAADQIKCYEHPAAVRGLKNDFDAMKWADAFVMVQPCGRSAALELGWAIGAGKKTLVLMVDGQEPELMIRLADHLCLSIDDVLDKLATVSHSWRALYVHADVQKCANCITQRRPAGEDFQYRIGERGSWYEGVAPVCAQRAR